MNLRAKACNMGQDAEMQEMVVTRNAQNGYL